MVMMLMLLISGRAPPASPLQLLGLRACGSLLHPAQLPAVEPNNSSQPHLLPSSPPTTTTSNVQRALPIGLLQVGLIELNCTDINHPDVSGARMGIRSSPAQHQHRSISPLVPFLSSCSSRLPPCVLRGRYHRVSLSLSFSRRRQQASTLPVWYARAVRPSKLGTREWTPNGRPNIKPPLHTCGLDPSI